MPASAQLTLAMLANRQAQHRRRCCQRWEWPRHYRPVHMCGSVTGEPVNLAATCYGFALLLLLLRASQIIRCYGVLIHGHQILLHFSWCLVVVVHTAPCTGRCSTAHGRQQQQYMIQGGACTPCPSNTRCSEFSCAINDTCEC